MFHSDHYVFSEYEYENLRLTYQGNLLKEISEDFIVRLGFKPGLKVLDLGCGTGEFTFIAAEKVGKKGKVVGIDRSTSAIKEAKDRAKELGFHNITFEEGDIEQLKFEGQYDVVMGRFILSYLEEPENILSKICSQLEGVSYLVFQEWQLDNPPPMYPLSDYMLHYHKIILETLNLAGVDMNMGLKLWSVFNRIPAYHVYVSHCCQYLGNANDNMLLEFLAETGAALLKPMIELGLIKSKEEFENLKLAAFDDIKQNQITLTLNPIIGIAAKL